MVRTEVVAIRVRGKKKIKRYRVQIRIAIRDWVYRSSKGSSSKDVTNSKNIRSRYNSRNRDKS
jgi:hypothetical protein